MVMIDSLFTPSYPKRHLVFGHAQRNYHLEFFKEPDLHKFVSLFFSSFFFRSLPLSLLSRFHHDILHFTLFSLLFFRLDTPQRPLIVLGPIPCPPGYLTFLKNTKCLFSFAYSRFLKAVGQSVCPCVHHTLLL